MYSEGVGVYSEGVGVYWTLRMSTNIQSTAYSLHIRFSEGQRNCILKTNLYKDHECTIERLRTAYMKLCLVVNPTSGVMNIYGCGLLRREGLQMCKACTYGSKGWRW